jgi:hypothetical protein
MAHVIACPDTLVLIVQLELQSVPWTAQVMVYATLTPSADVILAGLVRVAVRKLYC